MKTIVLIIILALTNTFTLKKVRNMKKIAFILLLFCASFINAQETQDSIRNISSNTKYKDFGVNYYGQNKVIFASSRDHSFLDLYIGDIKANGNITNAKNFSKVLNTRFHESNVAFTKDLKTIYFTRNNYLNQKVNKNNSGVILNQLYRAQIGENGKWTKVQKMPFNNDNYQTGHPVLNAAEDKLYFVSDMPGTRGLTDIYVVDIGPNGVFGIPKNLGNEVNTNKREMFPFIDENDILYFTSDGFEDNEGGLDIYATKLKEDGTYYKPKKLGFPINSEKDDFSFVKQKETNIGYFSSNRDGGKGDDDIYSFIQNNIINFECNQNVKGLITDKSSGELLPGAIAILYDDTGVELNRQIVGTDAKYDFKIDCSKTYKIKGNKEGYSAEMNEFIVVDGKDLNIPLSMNLDEFIAKEDKCIVKIETIYFDLNSSYLRYEAKIELNKVIKIMRKYPTLIIECTSHTDSRASNSYNDWLSARRAKRSMNYIISKGISSERISAQGYGEKRLINSCTNRVRCSETEHQLNRRTEFEIVNLNAVKAEYPEICLIKPIFKQKDEDLKINNITQNIGRKIKKNSEVKKIGTKTLIKIEKLNFDLNSPNLSFAVKQELDKVVKIMQNHPTLNIECASHTDARGSTEYNLWSSNRKAKLSVEYILSKGITPERISGVGYGETQLINKCLKATKCSEEEHQINTRTEFVIVNMK